MILCVTARGSTLESQCDPAFGRASYFLFVDTEGQSVDALQNVAPAHGAGVQAAQTVSDRGATVVVTGSVGPNAFQALMAAGLHVYVGASGTAQDAVDAYHNGTLRLATAPTGASHGRGRL
jgi:predicted Fe-Mo cluster-binding NifX family protein